MDLVIVTSARPSPARIRGRKHYRRTFANNLRIKMKWNQPTNDGQSTTYLGEYRGWHLKVVVDNQILKVIPSAADKEKKSAIKACDDYLDKGIVNEGRFDINGNKLYSKTQ